MSSSGFEARASAAGTVALVADGQAADRRVIVEAIRAWDPAARIVEAGSGHAVVACIETDRPSIAFVGLALDDLTGPEAIALAKAKGRQVPCLVLTAGRVVSRWSDVAQRLDAYEFLKTPFDPRHVAYLLQADRVRRTRLRVLLVDGSENGRQLVRRVLGRVGFTLDVTDTDNGRHALKLMRAESFDLALIDFSLAGLDGLEIACQARGLVPDTKLMLMTGGDADALAQAARIFGVDFVLKKPFFARDVDLALHQMFGLRRPYLLNALAAEPSANSGLRTQLASVPLDAAS